MHDISEVTVSVELKEILTDAAFVAPLKWENQIKGKYKLCACCVTTGIPKMAGRNVTGRVIPVIHDYGRSQLSHHVTKRSFSFNRERGINRLVMRVRNSSVKRASHGARENKNHEEGDNT
jgi:hypothetical protein